MSNLPEIPTVSIAILNWNGQKWLEKFLPSVCKTTYAGAEIWVIDNGSNDKSREFLSRHFPEVRQIHHQQNYGFTEGYNRAMPHFTSPYVVLLNSDVAVEPGWLEPLVEQMETNLNIAAIQPKILSHADPQHFEYAGAAGGYLDILGYPFCRGRLFDHLEVDQGQYDEAQKVGWASGACCMIRTSVIEQIGLFEAAFFAHMEEIDFCWRAQNFGYKILCEPKSVVYHVGGGTLQHGSPRKTFLNVRNSLAMLHKNLPASQLVLKIFLRLVLDGIWGLSLIPKGQWKHVWAIIRAHFAYYGRAYFIGASGERRLYSGVKAYDFPVHGIL